MPNYTIEQLQQRTVEKLPFAESFEFQEFSLDGQQPHVEIPVGQAVVGQEVVAIPVSPIDRYLDMLAKRAAIERLISQHARRDQDSMPVDHDANESFFEGINITRTSYDFNEENKFRTAVEDHYNALVNPSL